MTHFEQCNERLQAAITREADSIINTLWDIIFQHLDTHNDRFTINGEDAAKLAQLAVSAINQPLKEALAK